MVHFANLLGPLQQKKLKRSREEIVSFSEKPVKERIKKGNISKLAMSALESKK